MKIAYSGIEGSFASIAAEKIFPDGTLVPCKSFKEAYDIVESGECDAAVLPIENSFAGEVGQVTDLMYEGNLYVNGVYPLRVSQNLLGVKGSTLSDIKKVISHPQALEQCLEYLDAHNIETEQSTNTARAALAVAQKGDKSVGAIASKKTASLYGLDVIEQDINRDIISAAYVSKNTVIPKSTKNHGVTVPSVGNAIPAYLHTVRVITV